MNALSIMEISVDKYTIKNIVSKNNKGVINEKNDINTFLTYNIQFKC